MTLYKSVHK